MNIKSHHPSSYNSQDSESEPEILIESYDSNNQNHNNTKYKQNKYSKQKQLSLSDINNTYSNNKLIKKKNFQKTNNKEREKKIYSKAKTLNLIIDIKNDGNDNKNEEFNIVNTSNIYDSISIDSDVANMYYESYMEKNKNASKLNLNDNIEYSINTIFNTIPDYISLNKDNLLSYIHNEEIVFDTI